MMTKERGLNLLILGGGVAGQRIGAEKWFDPAVVGRSTDMFRAHIVDPNLPLKEFPGLVHSERARAEGRLTVSTEIPEEELFHAAYVGSSTGTHGIVTEELLELPTPPLQIIAEKPIAAGLDEEMLFRGLLESGRLDEKRIIVHESYLLLRGLWRFRQIIREQTAAGNPPTDINFLASKDRTPDVREGRTGNELPLEAYGVEYPHIHGAAGFVSDVDLGSGSYVQRNDYFQQVNGDPDSEATYTEFHQPEKNLTIRLAQGLGPFTMTHLGDMQANPHPPITRQAEVVFADGQRTTLDVQPAVDSKAQRIRPYRHSTLWHYDPSGEEIGQEVIADFPFKAALEGVLRRLDGLDAPMLEAVGVIASLERCVQLRELRESAEVREGLMVG